MNLDNNSSKLNTESVVIEIDSSKVYRRILYLILIVLILSIITIIIVKYNLFNFGWLVFLFAVIFPEYSFLKYRYDMIGRTYLKIDKVGISFIDAQPPFISWTDILEIHFKRKRFIELKLKDENSHRFKSMKFFYKFLPKIAKLLQGQLFPIHSGFLTYSQEEIAVEISKYAPDNCKIYSP